MTELARENLQSPRRSFLTEEQIFRLWSSAFGVKRSTPFLQRIHAEIASRLFFTGATALV